MSKNNKTKLSDVQVNEKAGSKSSYEDFMVLFFVGAFLVIDFLPYFKTFEIIAPQFLYLTILNIFVSLYIYSNPALHQTALVNIFKSSYVFVSYIVFILLCSVSIFFAKNISLGIVSLAEIIVAFTMVINFTTLFYNRLHLIVKVAFLVGFSAFLQAGKVLYNFNLETNLKPIYEVLNSNVMKGNAGNINILAASLLFKVPFIYVGITNFSNWKKWFLAVALVFATTVIFLISARAALLSLIIVTAIFAVYYVKTSEFKGKAALQLLYIVFPVVVSFAWANLTFEQSKLDPRFVSTAERLAQLNAEDGSINRRLVFYRAALGLAKEKPIVGIGLGNYRIESIPLDLSTNSSVPLHAHNDFLELTAETGFLNGLLYFSIFVVLLVVNVKRLFKSRDVLISKTSLLALLLLVIYGIDALFNFPFYRPTMQVCFSFLMAFTFVNIGDIGKHATLVNKKILVGLIALCALPLYFTYHASKTSNLEYLIQTDNINFASSGVLKGDDVVGRNPKFPNVFQSSESFVEYAGIYYFREKKYTEAIKLLDSANKINPYLGRPDFYKYLIANERGLPDSAYFYAKSAFYKRPVNDNFFETATTLAAARRDTAEILKMYETFPAILTKPASWSKAYLSLNAAGYSKNGLDKFKDLALKSFPADTIVQKSINQIAITDYIVKGQSLFATGKHIEALDSYQQGLKLDPTNIYVNQNIGFYYFNLSKPNLAIPYFKKALDLPGLNNGKTEFFLGLCYLNVGDKENACKYFKQAGNYPDAEKLLVANCR
ncbi:MAG: O-antigen ligase family protein [Pedobacter sp.]|uniref:O-antigen ligase family protein n=1 Tax=Pedobacter sp. TaxID=1411316 RepID=UPI002808BE14|nr:O-antigen ligase family protein [Pedobacter sp.]MDQ8004660.1 O-antigen ligase family protein [Pedobacter sp.]